MTKNFRLFSQFQPRHYELTIDLNETTKEFSGTVTIFGQSSADNIKLHSKDLIIKSAQVDGKTVEFLHQANDELILKTAASHNERVVVLQFEAKITDGMHGLYPCYFKHDGIKKQLIATQFESHHAREVFPCVDEPEAKATFALKVISRPNITVLGNMPVKKQTLDNQKLVTEFETSPRMSTYLLAFVAGEMHKKSAKTKSGVEVNVWATPAQSAESLDFALDVATRTIDFYNQYFQVDYPLSKCDHVALPDFSSGAMENWGLITYREICLLADPKTTSVSQKQYIATVIAHELAHQWFGNLVTMRWWNDLWLNESFANLMEYVAVDALYPEWEIWMEFASGEVIAALRRDAIDGVQPVQVEVEHPDQISTLFDSAIVYAKGARLLYMLRQLLGDDQFRAGLKQYFQKHAYDNTTGQDLWQALSQASGQNIADFMQPWLDQPGYPVVKVRNSNHTVQLEQSQFFIGKDLKSSTLWPIPLNSNCAQLPKILKNRQATAECQQRPLLLNQGASAHFIADYDQPLLDSIKTALLEQNLSKVDRLTILHERTLLARAERISSAELVDLIKYYRHETSEPVWGMIALGLAELRKFVRHHPAAEQALKDFNQQIALDQYQKLGWQAKDQETIEQTKLRSVIIGLMTFSEDSQALNSAQELFYSKPLEQLDSELRPLIIGSVVAHSKDSKVADQLLRQYSQTQNNDLQTDICSGLTSARTPELIDQLLQTMQNPEIVRPQDTWRWFAYLIRSRYAQDASWNWLQQNWHWIEKTYSGDKSYDDFIRFAGNALSSAEQLKEFKTFFLPKRSQVNLRRTIDLAINEIEARVQLIAHQQADVIKALLER